MVVVLGYTRPQMIRALLFNPANATLLQGGEELIDAWRQDANLLLWVDLADNPEDVERAIMEPQFGLHPLAVQDALRARHPPKLEAFDGCTFLLLKALRGSTSEFEFGTIQLAAFLGERFLLTRRSGESPSTDQLWSEVQSNQSVISSGLDGVLLRLCRIMVGRYLGKVLALENRLDEIEEDMLQSPNDELLAELVSYKTSLNKYRRVFLYHTQIFASLRSDPPAAFTAGRDHEVNDLYEQQERVASLASLYYEISEDLIEGYISVASHRLNNIVRVLTIITVVFVPLSFLAGIYGMNFENMPELQSRFGYFFLLSIMATIASSLLFVFRKKNWL